MIRDAVLFILNVVTGLKPDQIHAPATLLPTEESQLPTEHVAGLTPEPVLYKK